MSRLPIAISSVLLALAGQLMCAVAVDADVVGTIKGFKAPEIDIYSGSGEFLCAAAPEALERAAPADPCAEAVAAGKAKNAATTIPIKQVTDDGQFLVERGGTEYRLDPFQVDATMSEAPDVKARCPQLAGRTEMAATRGLGESGCETKDE